MLVMKTLNVLLSATLMGVCLATAAYAQTSAPAPYVDTACGTWQGDTWTPNGTCTGDVKRHARVEGTITIVKGHLVTVQQSTGTVVIDDTPALSNQFTGKVAVGRRIVAHGYWDGNNFYATAITTTESPTS
jgi:hypothetical protein